MTEREKMLAGELYNAADPELASLCRRARVMLRELHDLAEEAEEGRREILRGLLGSMGTGVHVERPFRCDYGCHTFVGDRVYMNMGCIILDSAHVRIGDDVMFGPSVQIYTAHHPIAAVVRIAGPELASPISIGDRCWIGGGAIILPGVTIGENSTIGAGSVVTRDVPANVVAAGNPCRVLRTLA